MNLKEKFAYMATGRPYNDLDPLLIKAREQSQYMTNKINHEGDPQKKGVFNLQIIWQCKNISSS